MIKIKKKNVAKKFKLLEIGFLNFFLFGMIKVFFNFFCFLFNCFFYFYRYPIILPLIIFFLKYNLMKNILSKCFYFVTGKDVINNYFDLKNNKTKI